MRRFFVSPLNWAFLLLLWLLLARSVDLSTILVGGLVALGAASMLRALDVPTVSMRRPLAAIELVGVVLSDVVRSNIAVGRIIILQGAVPDHTSGFLNIPLRLRHPVGLAALACIITATPGTAWARYESSRGVLTMHILDLVDEPMWIHIIVDRYEQRLLEIFQ